MKRTKTVVQDCKNPVSCFRQRNGCSKNPDSQGVKSGDVSASFAKKHDSFLDCLDSRNGHKALIAYGGKICYTYNRHVIAYNFRFLEQAKKLEIEVVKLTINKQLIKRISAIVLIILGIVFGGTWSSTGVCIGDNVFSIFGLPVWSKGTSGTHYPAIVGMVIILIGVGVLNTTLSKKARLWVWSIAIILLIIMGVAFTYV